MGRHKLCPLATNLKRKKNQLTNLRNKDLLRSVVAGDCAQVGKLCPKHTAMALAWEAVSKAARSNKLDEKKKHRKDKDTTIGSRSNARNFKVPPRVKTRT